MTIPIAGLTDPSLKAELRPFRAALMAETLLHDSDTGGAGKMALLRELDRLLVLHLRNRPIACLTLAVAQNL